MLFRSVRQVVVAALGFAVLVIGVAGIVLPFIPAVVVIPAGLAILATEFLWARRLLRRLRRAAGLDRGRPTGMTNKTNRRSGLCARRGGPRD